MEGIKKVANSHQFQPYHRVWNIYIYIYTHTYACIYLCLLGSVKQDETVI